jgi:hydrogenase maturation protein HypF
LAHSCGLNGYVRNNGDGVSIEIEGSSSKVEIFLKLLPIEKPPLSRIDSIEKEEISLLNASGFQILDSTTNSISTMLSPDISLCSDCLAEMRDKNNHRYNYPFINCTNCGPRYSIIKNLPYDRDKSSMDSFEMCHTCQDEYKNPLNRRYHAQPISCFECGPKLKYLSLYGEAIDNSEAIDKICELIKNGEVVAVKGVGGFHIVCDATNSKSIKALRVNKHRATKPLAVMFQNIELIQKVAHISKADEELILSKERPIVIVPKRESSILSHLVAPNIDRVGVLLPYTPLHEILLAKLAIPLVMTSANISGEPIIVDEKTIFKKMPLVVQHLLTYDREIINACDNSVVQNSNNNMITLRMARGYAPFSLYQKKRIKKKILALGANQKVTISLAFDKSIVVSPHIGDLNSLDANEYFQRTLETLNRIYNFVPDMIVCDKHQGYETSKIAKEYVSKHKDVTLLEVQHHYAHALSCMAEYSLDEDVLAFSFDGTGYGDDSTLWGGEVLIANRSDYRRVYHFKELSLLGGEAAIKEPRRVGISLLFSTFSLQEILDMKNPLVDSYSNSEIKTLYSMYSRGINSPKSSSLGRMFDAVYALSGFTQALNYEGESGLILETLSNKSTSSASFKYSLEDGVIEYSKMIPQIMKEKSSQKIAKKFINTVVKIICEIAQEFKDLPIVLSGGVFQNKVLVSKVTDELNKLDRKYYIQSKIPINDGGISVGQIYHAIQKCEG